MPFGTYATPESAFDNAVKLIQAGAQMVKLERRAWLIDTVRFLTERGVPVFAHLGLTPQSVHRLGGFKVQGKKAEDVEQLKADAVALQAAGASLLLLQAIPTSVGSEVTELLAIPTIGIGAGPDCSGQVLVMHDMLGVFPGKTAYPTRRHSNAASFNPAPRAACLRYAIDFGSRGLRCNEGERSLICGLASVSAISPAVNCLR
jgi:3-methyl-2-oxobutanoate hydroxymethyltransferase